VNELASLDISSGLPAACYRAGCAGRPATPDLQASHRRKTPQAPPARFYKSEHGRSLLIHPALEPP
jgi:hypothetical protein